MSHGNFNYICEECKADIDEKTADDYECPFCGMYLCWECFKQHICEEESEAENE